ncbi:MAG: hypothetical protein WAV90_01210 [Gordonia amarae]
MAAVAGASTPSPGATSSPAPTRTQFENPDTTDLDEAAARWDRFADESEAAWTAHRRNIDSPGGTVWKGDTRDAAFQQVSTDMSVVARQCDTAREAAAIARDASDTRWRLARKVVDAILDAEDDGFHGDEDLTVRDTGFDPDNAAARKTAAAEHADYINRQAQQYVDAEASTTERLQAKAVELAEPRFGGEGRDATVQLVDNRIKLDPQVPTPPPDPIPTGKDIESVLKKLPQGNSLEIREVRSLADLDKVWNWLKKHGTQVPNPYGPDSSEGEAIKLPDGTRVGRRVEGKTTNGATLDIKIPGEYGNQKVHVNPKTGGTVSIPDSAAPKPAAGHETEHKSGSETTTKAGAGTETKAGVSTETKGGAEATPKAGSGSTTNAPATDVQSPRPGRVPILGGPGPDNSQPYLVPAPAKRAGDPDLPVIGDGIPDSTDADSES